MVRGKPDWTRVTTLQDIRDVFGNIPEVSMGELAARLGSITIFERRGEVLFMDTFEDSTLKWEKGGVGKETIVRSNVTAKSGNYSLKLLTEAGYGASASIKRYRPLPATKRFGYEYSFALGSGIWHVYNVVVIYTADKAYVATLRYDPESNDLVIDAGGGVGDVIIDSDLDLKESDFIFHTWKIVFDFETGKYVRVFCNSKEYAVSAYELVTSTAGPFTPQMYVYTEVFTLDESVYIYVDDIILTQNEP